MKIDRVSIHINTMNRHAYLVNLLSDLEKQTYQNWDLIIIDDCSAVPVSNEPFCSMWIQKLRMGKHLVKVIRNPARLGITKSRNLALQMDTYNDWVLRIDDDSDLDLFYVEKLVKVAEEHEDAGAVGGLVPYLPRARYYRSTNKLKYFNQIRCNAEGELLSCEDDGHYSWWPDKVIESHHLRSSFLALKKALIDVGMYDNALGGSTGFREETDMCIRLLQAGYKLYTDTSALAWHEVAMGGGRDFQGRNPQEVIEQHEKYFRAKIKPILAELHKKGILKEEY